MSKTWYPVINYENCIECGACVDQCSHGVYNKEKHPRPVVVYPDGCVEGCTGCGSLCPAEAIEYFGDKKEIESSDSCNAGCGCSDSKCGSECNC